MTKQIYLIAESGRPKEVLETWRRGFLAAEQRLRTYMDAIGAEGAFRMPFEKPVAFSFPGGAAPDGWTKPDSRGASRPKLSNREDIERLEALEWCRSLEQIVPAELGLSTGMAYDDHGRRGSRRLTRGRMSSFSACWTISPDGGLQDVILIAPDYAAEVRETRKAWGGDINWLPVGSGPRIPEGFRRMTEAEVDLAFAQARVARERAEAAADDAFARPDLVEAYGFRVDGAAEFARRAPEALQARAAQVAIGDGGFSRVLWDPEDGADGFMLTGDDEAALRRAFVEHARVHFDPPTAKAAEDAPAPV